MTENEKPTVTFRIESQTGTDSPWSDVYPGQVLDTIAETMQNLVVLREAAREQETGTEFRVIGKYEEGNYTEEIVIGW
jgi:hypothetical protein